MPLRILDLSVQVLQIPRIREPYEICTMVNALATLQRRQVPHILATAMTKVSEQNRFLIRQLKLELPPHISPYTPFKIYF
jgi:hypothetical protein